MVAILEKKEFNTDFHPMVDFITASPLRYALTVKPTIFVSHIRQFWSTARIETTDEGTHILATVDGIQRTVSEASLRRNLKLRDEDGIVSIPDTELFENLTLIEYNISQNQKLTFQKGQFSHQWKYLIHTIMQCLSPKSTRRNLNLRDEDGIVSILDTELFENLTLMGIVPLFDIILVHQGEGSSTPTKPHHIPFPEAKTSHPTTSSIPLPSIPTALIPPVTQPDPTPIRQYTRRARTGQPLLSPPPCLMIQYQGLLPLLLMRAAQVEEIVRLKERVQVLENREGNTAKQSGDDAPINGRSINEGEAAAERISNDSEEIARVLTSIDAATVLAGELMFPLAAVPFPLLVLLLLSFPLAVKLVPLLV
nr:hypothetical protein [Tanacetum cinerariifolium]